MTIIIGEREVTTVEFVQHEINKLGKLLESGQIELNCYNIRREKAIDEAVKPDPSKDVTTVYVGHVHKGLTKEVVQDGFAQFGHVAKIEMLPSASKKPRKEWWAVFVEYVTHQAAGRAIFEMNNKIPDDWPEQHKPLLVKWAGTKEQTVEYQRSFPFVVSGTKEQTDEYQRKQQQQLILTRAPLSSHAQNRVPAKRAHNYRRARCANNKHTA
jgi:hypothetical protein|uniref:RRM domain-containing protein n=1 Tax=Eutreptiella gymnastica TaxID=73025 RepID=A0A7S4D2U0_9EUGL|eukprot:CAMPEP_0174381338 /NCGR_PEP_ID=MMETSP0811_2-20130205/123946_1 /TAXON_ID=73025 ORGANISM="Eutreptiella gymnastica-like, Strain CCMP1594" /NCGR_SAMPLE_ID=MMETSP0811_2 /ASSEMBLY_ACC=CAM_ASM_000667 /LENGTH=211 /DNA_ID=CAMNT_0015534449 /DNA_START=29 /DNA_END=664 /DNA_ORIENTATION=+